MRGYTGVLILEGHTRRGVVDIEAAGDGYEEAAVRSSVCKGRWGVAG